MRSLAATIVSIALTTAAAGPDKATPADDLKALQGAWKVTGIIWPIGEARRLPREARLNEGGTVLAIEGNRLTCGGETVATLTNDLPLGPQQNEIGLAGYRLLMLTLPGGKGLLCSYHIEGDRVEIAFDHTCSCHRGSGQIVNLERPSR